MLIRLSYASTLSPNTTTDDIDLIVERSLIRNSQYGVTGVLAVESGRVMQILEGPGAAVDELYSNICRDRRHVGVVMLDRIAIDERHFTKWAMVRRTMVEMLMMVAN
jgi:hypothetical protein